MISNKAMPSLKRGKGEAGVKGGREEGREKGRKERRKGGREGDVPSPCEAPLQP
jgi:hypothetical protein